MKRKKCETFKRYKIIVYIERFFHTYQRSMYKSSGYLRNFVWSSQKLLVRTAETSIQIQKKWMIEAGGLFKHVVSHKPIVMWTRFRHLLLMKHILVLLSLEVFRFGILTTSHNYVFQNTNLRCFNVRAFWRLVQFSFNFSNALQKASDIFFTTGWKNEIVTSIK